MRLLISFLSFFLANQLNSQINQFSCITPKPTQFEKVECNILLTASWENPYFREDISLDMIVTTPSGKMIVQPCFYVSGVSGGESAWGARFTPQEKGKYKCILNLESKNVSKETSKSLEFIVAPSSKTGFLHVNNMWTLKFDNGNPFRGIGENICWESRASDDSKFFKELHESPRFNYDYLLSSLANNGGNFYRTWICSWNLPLDWKDNFNNNRYTPSNEFYNPSAIQRLDKMLELADSLNIYVMLTLGPGAYKTSEGGLVKSAADFFVNPEAKVRYKNRLRFLVARWGYSPNIGAWEFFNEIDNIQFADSNNPIDPETIVKWHDEMSQYLKQIDPYNHIVTTSISHRDLKGLNSLANIDINQKHIYKNTSGIPSTIINYENNFKKAYVIGEFGFEWDWSKNFNDFAVDMDFDFKRGLWYGLFSPTPILPMSWWWEFFDTRGMTSYFKGVREINDQMLKAGNGSFDTIRVDAGKLEAFGVKCGKKVFVYLLNNSQESITNDVKINVAEGTFNIQQFIPVSVTYSNQGNLTSSKNGLEIRKIRLDSRKEMVLILEPENNRKK